MSNPTITLDLTNLDRDQTFDLMQMLDDDQKHYDANTDAIMEHASAHVFEWIREAEREHNFYQIDFFETVLLPDDYRAEGIWYDQIGWRYDKNDWSVTTSDGVVHFDRASWLDDDPARWDLVEEASREYSANGATALVGDIVTTLATMTRTLAPKAVDRPNKHFWAGFVIEYAAANYENGARA